MRVIHVYPYFNKRGGVERYLVELVCGQIRELRYERTAVACKELDQSVAENGLFWERIGKVLPAPKFLSVLCFAFMASFKSIMSRWHHHYDLVVSQGASIFKADIICAQSCHKAWFLQSLAFTKFASLPWLKKVCNPIHYVVIFIESIQYRFFSSARCIAISQVTKAELMRYYSIPERRIDVVYSGVNLSEFAVPSASAKQAQRKKLVITDQEIVGVFAGNEFRRKGLATLLQSYAKLPEHVSLIVIGFDDPAPYQKQIASLNMRHKIYFVGGTSNVAQYFTAADFFVFPTLYEPFGLVILEAMAGGLPVVTSKLAGAAELVHDGIEGVLLKEPKDVDELRTAIAKMLDPQTRQQMSLAARALAEKHSWERVVRDHDAVYRRCHPQRL